MIVVGTAGSGKSYLLAKKMKDILSKSGKEYKPKILVLSTTENPLDVAVENLKRMGVSFSMDDEVELRTYHKLALSMLSRVIEGEIEILDQREVLSNIEKAMFWLKKEAKRKGSQIELDSLIHHKFGSRKIRTVYDYSMNAYVKIEEAIETLYPGAQSLAGIVKKIIEKYHELKSNKYQKLALDFNEILLKFYELLEKGLVARKIKEYDWIFIDNYEDATILQQKITFKLAHHVKNIVLFCDSRQRIFSFKGGESKPCKLFKKSFPDTKFYTLNNGRRFSKEVLKIFKVIPSKDGKESKSDAITVITNSKILNVSSKKKPDTLVEKIGELANNGAMYHEIAVLCRSISDIEELRNTFTNSGIPFNAVYGKNIFDIPHIRAVQKFLELIVDTKANMENIWYELIKLLTYAKEEEAMSLSKEILKNGPEILKNKGYGFKGLYYVYNEIKDMKERCFNAIDVIDNKYFTDNYLKIWKFNKRYSRDIVKDDISRLKSISKEYISVSDFLAAIYKTGGHLLNKMKVTGRVTLITVHNAKSAEWDYVITYNIKPSSPEEKRVLYVAITRAKKDVYIIY